MMNTILFPALPKERVKVRTRRELFTLVEALDAVMSRNVARCCDVLVKRCRAFVKLNLVSGMHGSTRQCGPGIASGAG
eukprot:2905506-Amphidinium_carterae.3